MDIKILATLQNIFDEYGGAELYELKNKTRFLGFVADYFYDQENIKQVLQGAINRGFPNKLLELRKLESERRNLQFQVMLKQYMEDHFLVQRVEIIIESFYTMLFPKPVSTQATEEDGKWIDEYRVVYSADKTKLINGDKVSVSDYTVLSTCTIICDRAFSSCNKLRNIELPYLLTHIGEKAFQHCINIQSIIIFNSLKHIGDSAFENCINIQNIYIPENTKKYFGGIIPVDLHFLLEEFTLFKEIESSYTWIDKFGVIYSKDKQHLIDGTGISISHYVVNSNCRYIDEEAFIECEKLKSIILPTSLTKIEQKAFFRCYNLHTIILPNSLKKIANYTFSRCYNLHSIILPNSLKEIENYTFYRCYNLDEVVLPNSLKKIKNHAFSRCYKLQSIILPDSLKYIGSFAFKLCENIRVISLPKSVNHIEDNAFYLCERLRKIHIPDGTRQHFAKIFEIDMLSLLNELN